MLRRDPASKSAAVIRAFLVAIALLFAGPVGLDGQQSAPPAAEMSEIAARLSAIQQRALQDPALQTRQADLMQTVHAEMTRFDADFPRKLERYETVSREAATARADGDGARYVKLAEEGERLAAELTALRDRAMRSPAVAMEVGIFQADILNKMSEIEPDTDALLDRLEVLRSEG
jgi:hypothetical protein